MIIVTSFTETSPFVQEIKDERADTVHGLTHSRNPKTAPTPPIVVKEPPI